MSNVFVEDGSHNVGDSAVIGDIIVSSSGVMKIVGGNGIQINAGTSIPCEIFTTKSYGTATYRYDYDSVLKTAMEDHGAGKSYEGDEGKAYFCEDGALVVKAELPCNNDFFIMVDEHDAMKSCDVALKELENIKEKINSLQEKVFELSLSQKVIHD